MMKSSRFSEIRTKIFLNEELNLYKSNISWIAALLSIHEAYFDISIYCKYNENFCLG